jgi:O-methyltransferase
MSNLLRRAITCFRRPASNAGSTERPDYSAADNKILAQVRSFTMTSQERVIAVVDAARHIARSHIARSRIRGDVVECGVWRGGSAMAAALAFSECGDIERDFYLFDTFEGMTEPAEIDRRFDGAPAGEDYKAAVAEHGSWCRAGLDDVRLNMESTGYPAGRIHYVRGRVEDTIPASSPREIALLRLDTDWYESTKHELEHLYSRLVLGGILIIDDYGHWSGCRRAVDEFLASKEKPPFLSRIDYSGRIAVKSG